MQIQRHRERISRARQFLGIGKHPPMGRIWPPPVFVVLLAYLHARSVYNQWLCVTVLSMTAFAPRGQSW